MRPFILVLASLFVGAAGQSQPAASTTLIQRANVIDGTGSPARRADVRLAGDRVVAIGDLSAGARRAHRGCHGPVARAGLHRHAQPSRSRPRTRAGRHSRWSARVSRPSSSARTAADRISPPCSLGSRASRSSVNVASYAGHGAIRRLVLGKDFARHATAGRSRADEGAGQGRDGCRGARSVNRPRVRSRHLLRARRGAGARESRRRRRRPLHQPHAQRGSLVLGGARRAHHDRTRQQDAGAGLAHQARACTTCGVKPRS